MAGKNRIIVQAGIIVSLPDRSTGNSLSLRGASAYAPALKKVTEATRVVAAFVYTYTIASGVMYQSNAYPFIIAALMFVAAMIFPNGRRLCMVQIQAWTFMQQIKCQRHIKQLLAKD